jgi:hypothetical protein
MSDTTIQASRRKPEIENQDELQHASGASKQEERALETQLRGHMKMPADTPAADVLKRFQCQYGLEPTGKLDAITAQRIKARAAEDHARAEVQEQVAALSPGAQLKSEALSAATLAELQSGVQFCTLESRLQERFGRTLGADPSSSKAGPTSSCDRKLPIEERSGRIGDKEAAELSKKADLMMRTMREAAEANQKSPSALEQIAQKLELRHPKGNARVSDKQAAELHKEADAMLKGIMRGLTR